MLAGERGRGDRARCGVRPAVRLSAGRTDRALTLRVLTLSTLYPDASRPSFAPFVERQTQALAALADVEVRVVAPLGIAPFLSRHERYRRLAALPHSEVWNGIEVHRPRFVHLPGNVFDAPMLVRALRPGLTAIRRTFAFDVIAAQFFFPDGPAAVALGRQFGVPVSIKARGGDIHYWGARPAIRRQIVAAGGAADGLLAVSAALQRDMVALGMDARRIAVHPTGVDRAIFFPRDRAAYKARLGITGPLIVSIGTLSERKGQQYLIEALASMPGARLVLIGHGDAEARFRADAETHGVADRVVFAGSLEPQGVADWLGAADVMALASQSEGLANAWVEALASGTPIVVPDIGGAREVVDRPAAGIVTERNALAIAEAIGSILANPPDRKAVAAVVAAYSWEANALALRDHLRALV